MKKILFFQMLFMMLLPLRISAADSSQNLDSWLVRERKVALAKLYRNISPPGALPGAVVASPSREHPDYHFVWVRDSAITAKALLELYEHPGSPDEKGRARRALEDFVDFTKTIQSAALSGESGLGEPKFYVDGSLFNGNWARPQLDGPAARALEMIHFARLLLRDGERDFVRRNLYDSRLPTRSIIKNDLEYLSRHWNDSSFDAWEEIRGHHFYTLLLVRKALVEGAELALDLMDSGAASWYLGQSAAMEGVWSRFWDPHRHILIATIDRDGGIDWKESGLDSSVIVGVLGGHTPSPLFPLNDERILATFVELEKQFKRIYGINQEGGIPGVAIGRYPEDRYDGYDTHSRGNPWSSLTLAFGLFCYRLADSYFNQGMIAVTPMSLEFFERLPMHIRAVPGEVIGNRDPRFREVLRCLVEWGDSFLERVKAHANPDGSLSEQMNRETGFQQGAEDLGFGYSAFLLAFDSRRKILGELGN